jgi:hypothetical protein
MLWAAFGINRPASGGRTAKMLRASVGDREFYEGLATVVRESIDRPALARAMRLPPDQKITLAQTVGYPKK